MGSGSAQPEELRASVAVVGAGVIGSALAMALARQGIPDVLVVDPDLEGTLSSSELNAGGVRATFNQEINILASKLSIDYFAEHADEIGYRACGYLWMHGGEGLERARKSVPLWARHGWEVQEWDVARLRRHAPFIDKTDDLAGALFGPRDGLLNPNLLKLHFRAEAKRLGARFLDRALLRAADVARSGVELRCDRLPANLGREGKEAAFGEAESSAGRAARDGATIGGSAGGIRIRAEKVVNCAGPWAGPVAKMLGYSSPCYAVRRQICLFDAQGFDMSAYGMMIDPSGVYFHPEATYVLAGIAVRDEPQGMNFAYDGESFFQDRIWMPLYERSTKFEALKHVTGWGGLYEVSPDESAIIGEVGNGDPKGTGRVFDCHSFSGHGVMHSYAVGVALAEKIANGRYETLDLSPLAGSRFETGRLVSETAVI